VSFFNELKRRNVFRVGIAYLIGSWLLAQIAELLLETFNAPDWTMKFIVVTLLIGFPIALFFAWAFELTPDGVKRESEVDRARSVRQQTGSKLDRVIIVILVIALGYFIWESRFHEPTIQTDAAVQPVSVNTSTESLDPSGPPSTISNDKSVAVLPFVNMSSDPEQEYFSDGITEEIINALVKIPGLSVPARTSVFGFKGHQGDVRKIGLELGVGHVLEGSIRSQGNQVRITAQLIKVDDGFHLWSETFDRKLDNIFVVQEEIATAIAGVLTGELGFGVTAVPNQTRNMEAYDIYLQGRALLRKRDDLAVEVLENATRADPGFAPALAALAIAYQVNEMDDKAMQTADRALQIDPDNVDALDAMASALRSKMRWAEAESFYDRALAIDPQSSELLEDYAEFLSYVGRTEEALNVTTRGFAIDQNLVPLAMAHMEALTSNGRLDEALRLADEVASENPGNQWLPEVQLAIHLAQGGHVPDELLNRLEIPQDMLDTVTAIVAAPHDDLAIERLKSRFSVEYIKDKQLALDDWFLARLLFAYAGESDYVLDLDMAIIKLSSYGAQEWTWTPNLKSIRKNPRYEKYLEMAGLIEYWDATNWPVWCQRLIDGRVECQ
jgi:TolB-like protein/Flp pilus assembly protein TadD